MKKIRKVSAILLTVTLLTGCSYKIETKGPSDGLVKETQSTVTMTEGTEVSGNDLTKGTEVSGNDLTDGYSYLEQVTISNDGYEVPVYSIKNPISRFLDGTLVTCQKSGIDFECCLAYSEDSNSETGLRDILADEINSDLDVLNSVGSYEDIEALEVFSSDSYATQQIDYRTSDTGEPNVKVVTVDARENNYYTLTTITILGGETDSDTKTIADELFRSYGISFTWDN